MKKVAEFGFLVVAVGLQTACSPVTRLADSPTPQPAGAVPPDSASGDMARMARMPLSVPEPAAIALSDLNSAITRWRYVRGVAPETTLLDIGTPREIQLCVDNLKTTVYFQITTQGCNGHVSTSSPVATGCSSFRDVRKVTIVEANNPSVDAAGGLLKHVNLDTDPTLSTVDRSVAYQWSYTGKDSTDIYVDPQRKPRVLRVCVNKGDFRGGWGVNFQSKGHSCNPTATNTFLVTGVVNAQYGVTGACAVVEASQLSVERGSNPAGPAQGTYEFLR